MNLLPVISLIVRTRSGSSAFSSDRVHEVVGPLRMERDRLPSMTGAVWARTVAGTKGQRRGPAARARGQFMPSGQRARRCTHSRPATVRQFVTPRAIVRRVTGQVDALAPGTRVGGRYVVAQRLGGGAMGSVYEVTRDSGEHLALKALLAPSSKGDAEERRARFLREAAVCATIRHPHVVPVLDHGIDEGTDLPYLVMPLLHGEDLAAVLERVGCLEPETAIAPRRAGVRRARGGSRDGRGASRRQAVNLFLETGEHVVVKVTDFRPGEGARSVS